MQDYGSEKETHDRVTLPDAARAWGGETFETVFKREVLALGLSHLPLQKGMSTASVALDSNLEAVLLKRREANGTVHVRLGVFFSGVIAGCNCADDPTPENEVAEYCELDIRLELSSARASIALASGR